MKIIKKIYDFIECRSKIDDIFRIRTFIKIFWINQKISLLLNVNVKIRTIFPKRFQSYRFSKKIAILLLKTNLKIKLYPKIYIIINWLIIIIKVSIERRRHSQNRFKKDCNNLEMCVLLLKFQRKNGSIIKIY